MTDNNPLTYLMMTPNLNATGHWWVGALARFNFQLEYQKGWDNIVADVLSWDTTPPQPRHSEINPQQSNSGSCTLGRSSWPHHNWRWPWLKARGMCYCRPCILVQMHMLLIGLKPRGKIQRLSAVLDWLEAQKKTDLKTLLGEHASSEEGQLI